MSNCAETKTYCNRCKSMTKSKRVSRAKHECTSCAHNKCFGDLLQSERISKK